MGEIEQRIQAPLKRANRWIERLPPWAQVALGFVTFAGHYILDAPKHL